jgi:hypothetical protein
MPIAYIMLTRFRDGQGPGPTEYFNPLPIIEIVQGREAGNTVLARQRVRCMTVVRGR